MRWWQRQSLRFKLALGIGLAMLLTLGGAFVGISEYIQTQLWQREAQAAANLNAVAATLLKDAMMVGHRDQIQQALEKLGQNVGGRIDAIAVYDDHSTLTSFATGFPEGRTIHRESLAQDLTAPGCWDCHQLPADERPAMTVVSLEGQEVMRSVVPLYNEPRCQSCHGTGIQVLGDSIVDLRLDQFQQASTTIMVGLAVGIALTVALVALVLYLLLRGTVLSPLGELVAMAEAVTGGDLERQVEVRSRDEVGQVGLALNDMTSRLRELIGSLEQRVTERTKDLEKRSAYLEASSDVARATASILEVDTLVQQTVDLIKERFDLYYVGLFLVDEINESAVLAAGTGEAGQKMLARGHELKVGEGMIGWSIANAQARVARDVGEDAVRFDNPDLPDTRSEAAIPLRSRGRVLGALSAQSTEVAAFDPDSVTVLQTMADQVAVALDNARLFAESQEALEAERRAYGRISREAWSKMARGRAALGYLCDQKGQIMPSPGSWQPEMIQATQTGRLVQDGGSTLAIPVRIRENVEGVVRLRKPDGAADWTPDEIELTKTLAEQLGVALESARLYQETQRRAARDRLLGEVTARVRQTLDMDTVLQTAIREIGQALELAEVEVRMGESTTTRPAGALASTGGNGHEENEEVRP
jgi:GAF domain-containing protein/HAMP domain-containing protein